MNITLNNLLPFPIKELDYSNSEIWAIDNLCFESQKSYLVRANSGKGKTTLLSAIYGIRKDYEGDILLNSEKVKSIKNNQFADIRKTEISYVFQGLELFDELTVFENVEIKNRLTKNKTDSQIDNLFEQLDILSLKNRITKTLSFGQKQRVAIVRALCQPFKWILLDEPFSHLDIENITKAFQLIKEESTKNNAGLIITSLSTDYGLRFDKTFII